MKLYHAPGACSLAVHIALRERGLSFEAVAVDLATHRTADGDDYTTISPRGYVPLLQLDDGSRHTEVAALLQHVADGDPEQGLIGTVGSTRRLAVTEALAFVATELHKVFSPWLFHADTADSTVATVKSRLAARFRELEALFTVQPWIAGAAYSVADAYAYTVLSWARFVAIPLTPYPELQAYLRRVASRPAVQAALKAEGPLR